ncbi:MAG: glycosyl hydrolase 115 family protein [Dysgonamonadaceae bacterium]|jgi:hypothetical protein|nr:glycosyl hydrolase 115 family protein [Dysgonamonadaceae bacterium]
MKNLLKFIVIMLLWTNICTVKSWCRDHNNIVSFTKNDTVFLLTSDGKTLPILIDVNIDKGIERAINDLLNDFERVIQTKPALIRQLPASGNIVLAGEVGTSSFIDALIKSKKLDVSSLHNKRETYIIQTISNPFDGIDEALVIAGSDKRGTIYGIYELSRQIGVSPWYWWADVPVMHRENLYVKRGKYTDGEPAVRWRGIFINDEAPAFQGWCEEKFGGVNAKMYEHMFELILRLKGNFLWPAMWGNALYYDDPRSGALADEMGIVLGTSHHEPMGRAHEEWNYLGKGAWDYDKNPEELREFWRGGMERMKDFETVVTVGMRGDGDAPMSEGANIALLQRIIKDQRDIIAKVTGKKAEERPQAWALYKEVQDYYDKGMRVPDDITLLLCDDNWGNVRKLPDPKAPKRKGGYGIYYHFDYVGGPRNYKWLNVTQNERTYEQMSLAYRHGVDRIWVVNVGDLKPMEFPISFFLDLAWNPDRFNAQNIAQWTEEWVRQQFGGLYTKEIARMLDLYTKYNSRVTPELLDDKTFSLDHYNEYQTVLNDYKNLAIDALRLYNLLPAEYRDAFDELVLFPINGVCNLYEMYYALALNKKYAAAYDMRANAYADKVKECFTRDSLLTQHYNKDIAGGKWAHQMDQQRIGYTNWNNPPVNIMPKVEYVYRAEPAEKRFVEADGYVAIEAHRFARAKGDGDIRWEIIPNLGRTGSAVTTFPQAAYPPPASSVHLEYDLQTTFAGGDMEVQVFLAPTLNFNANKGLRYALSFDGGEETVVNFNGHYQGELGAWQGERIIKTATKMKIGGAGNHTLRIRVLEPGIVFEKILFDFGGLKPTYLGAPESEYINDNSPFPAFPPRDGVSSRLDHDQMLEQLGIKYPVLPPGAGAPNKSSYNTARSPFGLWTNYVQAWETGGDYYTGAKFYKPLKLHDLSGLTAQTWAARRAEIFNEVQKIYGYIPPAAADLKIEWTVSEPVVVTQVFSRAGLVETTPFRQYQITGKIDSSAYPNVRNVPVISGTLRIPASVPEGTKAPVVINYAFSFGRFVMGDEELWNTMSPDGIGVLYFNAGALQPDNGEGLTSYLVGLVNKGAWRKPTDWGSLVAWSWGISRFIDFFEQDNSPVDAKRVALTGHSRYGKATLVAMAYDERIAAAFPSSSGAMGVAPTRRHWGEDLENCADNAEYHWMAGNAMLYAGVDETSADGYLPRKVINMPVDAESLVALCAPRPVFIGSGSDNGDAWTDPYGQYLTAVAASPVYELLGKRGIVMTDFTEYNGKKIPMPVTDKAYLSGDIGYRLHHGGHVAAPNYPAFKEFILKYWK